MTDGTTDGTFDGTTDGMTDGMTEGTTDGMTDRIPDVIPCGACWDDDEPIPGDPHYDPLRRAAEANRDTEGDAPRDVEGVTTHTRRRPPAPSPTGAVAYDAADIIAVFAISARELGWLTHRSERSVRRWIAGTSPPKGLALHRMTLLARIAYYLDAGVGELPAREWLRAPNAGLNGRVPLDLLVADKAFTVAEFLATGTPAIRDPFMSRRQGRAPGFR